MKTNQTKKINQNKKQPKPEQNKTKKLNKGKTNIQNKKKKKTIKRSI